MTAVKGPIRKAKRIPAHPWIKKKGLHICCAAPCSIQLPLFIAAWSSGSVTQGSIVKFKFSLIRTVLFTTNLGPL